MRLQFLLSLMVTLDLLFSCIQVSSTKNRAQSNDSDSNHQGHELSREKLLGLLLDNPIYNYKIPPQYDTDIPVMVDVQLLIMSFDSVNELSMDLQMNIFLLQIWKDSRLDFSHISKMEKLELDIKMMNNVWVPDTFFRNEKYGEMHRVTKPNKMMHLLRDGTVYYSVRLTATLSCNMNLQNYPLDDQKCPIVLSSYGYSSKNLIYRWLPRAPVLYDDEMQLAQYSLKNHHLRNYTKTHETGSFSCLRVDFMLQRKIGYYIIQVYVPSMLVVILSWVSFWIDIEAIPARISLGVVTVLTITTQASGMRSSPRVSYIKAIDVWMASCLVFVFMTVLEFAYINVVIRRYKVKLSCLTELPSDPVLALSSHTPEMSSERLPDSQKIGKTSQQKRVIAFSPDSEIATSIVSCEEYIEPSQVVENKEHRKSSLVDRGRSTHVTPDEHKETELGPIDQLRMGKSKPLSAIWHGKKGAKFLDRIARVFFPMAFTVFNIFYWSHYAKAFETHTMTTMTQLQKNH